MTKRRDAAEIAEAVAEFQTMGARRTKDERGYLVVEVPRGAIAAQPWLRWNAFVALLSYSDIDDLHPSQQDAARAFEYDSDVQNGGHELYLEAHGIAEVAAAIASLRRLGALPQAAVLLAAIERRTRSSGDHLAAAFEDLDAAFGSASPSLVEVLEATLSQRPSDFVLER